MKKIRVCVTAEDIAKGKRDYARKCPVARAIRRTLKTSKRVVVWPPIYVGGKLMGNSGGVAAFVRRFDQGKPVKPFTFVLMVSS